MFATVVRVGRWSAQGFKTLHDRHFLWPALMLLVITAGLLMSARWYLRQLGTTAAGEFVPGVSYANYRSSIPWSAHVVKVALKQPDLEIRSVHALEGAVGMGTLSSLVRTSHRYGRVLAAVNGDYYQREKEFAGDPRGLQIVDGELLSGPMGGVSFWFDVQGRPRVGNVASEFRITWPNGQVTPFGLNEDRRSNNWMVLYTPAVGLSTRTKRGRELVLERAGDGPWLPLQAGGIYTARVREANEGGDTCMAPDVMVLSLKPTTTNKFPVLQGGELLTISTATTPNMVGVKTALSGGPLLVLDGKIQKWGQVELAEGQKLPFGIRSMNERHPRTAIGWNDDYLYMFEVDGRQKKLSAGMTLKEVAQYLMRLGCRNVMNLDGGGSATLWCNGKIVNSPCDKMEREIANALVVVRQGVREDPLEMAKYYWADETNRHRALTNRARAKADSKTRK